ncbi:hypothetical protein A3B45_03860 [Candidatus Daviesbacteria bacterium RIFCSPLOWO2_01_FULL_39_12]|uniref:Phosphatidic acid phosphatase type 2/haloperoxidase domain-containing protein n=1 Tax=Candidatus Daviesbacteria bacterium RIFCSPLOWO2_01_FULL_39_12 TaxID=1797785 RepID=A0A1F5KTX2_9BACT|nr:MAG: hypothetical protein A3D79_03255 [Candidatus Daviesbacteria bacterium RIFCSPHIGHO2_02_FULL_39_8]OGE44383.1 MAG: hypothetical protein A3B45_03860 [Candidatus Daviesbacteria bacterium RIFCSPLOWO2_01_FULL_39_12]
MNNISVFFLIFNLRNQYPFVDALMIFGAEYLIYLVFILMILLTFKGKINERKAIILALLSLPIAVVLIKIIHLFILEPRPYISYHITPLITYGDDVSFPSRHASIVSAIAFSYLHFKSKWFPLFLFMMVWVGFSRIYVGVHYPIDILGGFLVGIISQIISLQIIKFLKARFFLPSA